MVSCVIRKISSNMFYHPSGIGEALVDRLYAVSELVVRAELLEEDAIEPDTESPVVPEAFHGAVSGVEYSTLHRV